MFDQSAENPAKAPVALVNQPSGAADAVIGSSIRIKGDISGSENLVINGQVEGSVHLQDNDLVIGQSGQIKANLTASEVEINGEVMGDITGVEKVTVSSAGRVQGNIVAPRVTLEDGAKFKGSIDMDPSSVATQAPSAAPEQADSVKQALRDVRKKSAANGELGSNPGPTAAKG
ncbi:MAG: polymer-forming cytoskeletal protein [Pseudomonadales bacterium]